MFRLIVFVGILASCLAAVPQPRDLIVLPAPAFPIRGRIVGGVEVDIEKFPYLVAFQYNSQYVCGGSIIRPDVVLSAAHCMFSLTPSVYSFRAGSNFHSSGGQVIGAEKVIQHEKYKGDYDFGLFILVSSFELGSKVGVINLPYQDQGFSAGTVAMIAGWGKIQEDGPSSDVVRAVAIPIVDQNACNAAYKPAGYKISDVEICAGFLGEGGKDACQGDSGGPLEVMGLLVGVTSWGIGCARPEYPGVWARVPSVVNWIHSNWN